MYNNSIVCTFGFRYKAQLYKQDLSDTGYLTAHKFELHMTLVKFETLNFTKFFLHFQVSGHFTG